MNPKWNSFRLLPTTRRLTSFLLLINKLPRANTVCCGGIGFKLSEGTENLDLRCHLKGLHCFTVLSYSTPHSWTRFQSYSSTQEMGGCSVKPASPHPVYRAFLQTRQWSSSVVRGLCFEETSYSAVRTMWQLVPTLQRITKPSLTFSWFPRCRPQGRGRRGWERVS